ncbi:unnamed protein product [Lupinus luteus]|uniref:YbaK/aminoacyl-tRNA synthetase-associated domain-containing protein n=1 Tax=Lupinus luteus TaxID=3873 RepID=A0AAV1X284_LUPLU
MGFSKEQLLTRLKELQIEFSQYEHPVILTVEAGEKYVGHLKGGKCKNLFLKDKKQRFYIFSALIETKVDLKVLSQRLGLGKGGLRMAPEEALGEILQVPLGCVTPFAVVNESARDVSLLLDQGLKTQEVCLFHPLSNDMTISLNARELEKFLKSIGRDPVYVDFEANPTVGKDQPPDLAALVPSSSIVLPDQPEKQPSSQFPANLNHASVDNKSKTISAKLSKPSISEKNTKEKHVNKGQSPSHSVDIGLSVDEILHKASELLLSEINDEAIKQHGEHLGTVVFDNLRKGLSSDLKDLAMIIKNTAYTEGFHAGIHHQPRRL